MANPIQMLLQDLDMETDSMDADLETLAMQDQMQEDQMYADMVPDIMFPERELQDYSAALSEAMRLFTDDVELPEPEDGMLTPDHMRGMLMVQAAAQDAAAVDEIAPDLVPEVPDSEMAITIETGKLKSLAGSRDFKRFLRAPAPVPAEDEDIALEEG